MTNKYTTNQSEQFKNKIIVVTGSTQGSGAETAKLLASRGAKGITICGRNQEQGLQVKKEIEQIGSKCLYVKKDKNIYLIVVREMDFMIFEEYEENQISQNRQDN